MVDHTCMTLYNTNTSFSVHRWKVIPLVSPSFRQAHNAYPPQRKEWTITKPITQSMVDFFFKIAPWLETLHVLNKGHGLLPQLFALAAVKAPRLRTLGFLHYNNSGEPLLQFSYVGVLRQITKLTCNDLIFPEDGRTAEIQSLSGLLVLEVHP
jgi:hypothetical protein